MNKKLFFLLPAAMLALTGCKLGAIEEPKNSEPTTSESSSSSSSSESSSSSSEDSSSSSSEDSSSSSSEDSSSSSSEDSSSSEEPPVVPNDGSYEHPFLASEIRALTAAMESGAVSSQKYYFKGVIKAINFQNKDGFGRMTIADDASSSDTFIVYNAYDYEGQGLPSADYFAVGNSVTFYSSVINYQGNTPETSGPAELVALNGVEVPTATAIALEDSSIELEVGKTVTLNPITTPSNASKRTLPWSSSNEEAVSLAVQENGSCVVTALAADQTVTVTVSVSASIKASATITTKAALVETTLFTADLTDTSSVTSPYTITNNSVQKKTGFYQDSGTANSALCGFTVKNSSVIISSEPTEIRFTANLGGGSAKDPLDHNVEVMLVNASGAELTGSRVTVTTKITPNGSTAYSCVIPYVAGAYGIKLEHMKENSWNLRYYSFSLVVAQAA